MNRNIRQYYKLARDRQDIKAVIQAQNCIVRNDIKPVPKAEREHGDVCLPSNPYVEMEKFRKKGEQAMAEGNIELAEKMLIEMKRIKYTGKVRAA